ncbi:E-selectin isoform X2 [Varanus komodoensis]|uniref:E-selectin isoform X2 n=1 Tax=Varanus komodoensis TaxID=61221 RepID=UPI001CF77BE5|nr:E-selectin isoform X2 [Varanus komodoensis]
MQYAVISYLYAVNSTRPDRSSAQKKLRMTAFLFLFVVLFGSFKQHACWTYHASDKDMSYTEAEAWCTQHFTHLVAIQNQEENKHLNEAFPANKNHYWIGIRKKNNEWVWTGTNKPLTEEAKNWARGEPNNRRTNEDCVEIYIKRARDAGKWNDEACSKRKAALCYTASCKPHSCNGRGECVETINNYTCVCDGGFHGRDCEHGMAGGSKRGPLKSAAQQSLSFCTVFACDERPPCLCSSVVVPCDQLDEPSHGTLECRHPVRDFSFNSSCHVRCSEGYAPTGLEPVTCTASGNWSAPIPVCEVKCPVPQKPANGSLNCSHPVGHFAWNSSCNFACQEGFLLKGSDKLQCRAAGEWDGREPECEAVRCEAVQPPEGGSATCSHPASELAFNSTCEFACLEGYTLRGAPQIQCTAAGLWSEALPVCEAVRCEAVQPPEGGSVTCSSLATELAANSTCEFACLEGRVLKGASRIQCSSTGQWSLPPPKCEAHQAAGSPLKVGAAVTGGFALTAGSLTLWLMKHLRRKAKKFTPVSSCHSLDSEGTFQSSAHLI